MMQVIRTETAPRQPRISLAAKYIQGYIRSVKAWTDNTDSDAIKKIIFYGVKFIARGGFNPQTESEVRDLFQLSVLIRETIGKLTPRQLSQIFPVHKTYSGQRTESKDYFYTMEVFEKHGMDTVIGDSVNEILWDCTNIDLTLFNVETMGYVDTLRRIDGQPGMLEEFFGLKPWTQHTDAMGKSFMVQKDTGKVVATKKRRPRYLRPV